jgi:hypothetical protein
MTAPRGPTRIAVITPELNLVQFSSGNGDGGYPVFVGYDAFRRPTCLVVDFYLLHMDWPGPS